MSAVSPKSEYGRIVVHTAYRTNPFEKLEEFEEVDEQYKPKGLAPLSIENIINLALPRLQSCPQLAFIKGQNESYFTGRCVEIEFTRNTVFMSERQALFGNMPSMILGGPEGQIVEKLNTFVYDGKIAKLTVQGNNSLGVDLTVSSNLIPTQEQGNENDITKLNASLVLINIGHFKKNEKQPYYHLETGKLISPNSETNAQTSVKPKADGKG